MQRLEEELAASRDQGEARMLELHAETEALWKERRELLDEIHGMGTRLLEIASGAAAPLSPREPAAPAEETKPHLGAEAETEPGGAPATDEAARSAHPTEFANPTATSSRSTRLPEALLHPVRD